jgi:hypothetical protein
LERVEQFALAGPYPGSLSDGNALAPALCGAAAGARSPAPSQQKFGQQIGLLFEPLGVFIGSKKIRHLVAKDGHATRLEPDDAYSVADLRTQRFKT